MLTSLVVAAATYNGPPIVLKWVKPALPETDQLLLLGSDGRHYIFLDRSRTQIFPDPSQTQYELPVVRVTMQQISAAPEFDPQGRSFKFVLANGEVRCDRRTWTLTRASVFDAKGDYILTAGREPEQPIVWGQSYAKIAAVVCDHIDLPAGNSVVGWRAAWAVIGSKDPHPIQHILPPLQP